MNPAVKTDCPTYTVQNNVIYLGGNNDLPPKSEKTKTPKLKKDGTPKKTANHKKSGKKSEAYPLTIEDMKKLAEYFKKSGKHIHYLYMVISCNIARRSGDFRALNWSAFFKPNGEFRSDLEIPGEEKTGFLSATHINTAVRDAIDYYCKVTGCDPSVDNYNIPVFYQYSGTHPGSVITYSGLWDAIKKACEKCGIEYNVATHSYRKTFGSTTVETHPYDPRVVETLQSFYGHSSTAITNRYIGITKASADSYVDDFGELFTDSVLGDKEIVSGGNTPLITIDASVLRELIALAYTEGTKNAGSDTETHIQNVNTLLDMVDENRK